MPSAAISLTQEDFKNAEREYCKRSLSNFVRRAWAVVEPIAPYVHGKAIDVLCDALQAVTEGRSKRLLINIPPGTGKSLITSVLWPAWEWGPCNAPHRRYVAVAHDLDLAMRDTAKMRRLVKSDWYQEHWPHVAISTDQDAKKRFENTATGFRVAKSSTGVTGERGDCLLPDTLVQTEFEGARTIKSLVDSRYSGRVLSYDADTKRVVYRSVEAVARRRAEQFYRIHFARGGFIECTGDHRVYTTRGYIEARLLSSDDIILRSVPKANAKKNVRDKEAHQERIQDNVLLSPMRSGSHEHSGGQCRAVLHGVRGEDKEVTGALLLERVSARVAQVGCDKDKPHKGRNAARYSLQSMRGDVQSSVVGADAVLLLEAVQGRRSLEKYARAGEPRLAEWGGQEETPKASVTSLGGYSCGSSDKGPELLCRMWRDAKFARPPYQHDQHRSSPSKSCNALRGLPLRVARCGEIEVQQEHISLVERICRETDVYDIQVEGTRCFFANQILVHNCVIFDDPHSVSGANSDTIREEVVRNFREAVNTRINNPELSAIVVIMQRLHAKDVSGSILELGGWDHVCLPMRFVPKLACDVDWRTDDGELLFPERFPETAVQELERTLGPYAAAGQLQQTPTPRQGGLFDSSKIEIVDTAPPCVRWVRSWDFAASVPKPGQDPDWSVGLKMGMTRDQRFVIAANNRFRKNPTGVDAELIQTASMDGKGVRVRLAQDPGAAGKSQVQMQVRALRGYTAVSKPVSGSKITRAEPLASQVGGGNVLMVRGDWNQALIDELSIFPGGAHDDQVDAAADAFDELVNGKWIGGMPRVVGITV